MNNTISRKEIAKMFESGVLGLHFRRMLLVAATLGAGVALAATPADAGLPDAGVPAAADAGVNWDVTDLFAPSGTTAPAVAPAAVTVPAPDAGVTPTLPSEVAPTLATQPAEVKTAPVEEPKPEAAPMAVASKSEDSWSADPDALKPVPAGLARHYGPTDRFHWSVIGYGAMGIINSSSVAKAFDYSVGARGFFDWKRLSVGFQYENFVPRTQANAIATHHAKALIGVVASEGKAGRLRILLGADFGILPAGTILYSPTIALAGRVGNGMFSFDSGLALTAFPYWQAELRAALVIRVTFVELHLGWYFTVAANDPAKFAKYDMQNFLGSLVALKEAAIIQGPQVGLGFGW